MRLFCFSELGGKLNISSRFSQFDHGNLKFLAAQIVCGLISDGR